MSEERDLRAEEKRLGVRVVAASFLFVVVTVALAWLLGDSYFVPAFALVGWFVFLGYTLKLRPIGSRRR